MITRYKIAKSHGLPGNRETQNGSDPFPKMMLATGGRMWGDKGKMVAALPLISPAAAAPSVYATDTLWQLVLG